MLYSVYSFPALLDMPQEVTFQDFYIRGKAVYLKIKRRRGRLKSDLGKIVQTNFQFVAEGAGFTQEPLSF